MMCEEQRFECPLVRPAHVSQRSGKMLVQECVGYTAPANITPQRSVFLIPVKSRKGDSYKPVFAVWPRVFHLEAGMSPTRLLLIEHCFGLRELDSDLVSPTFECERCCMCGWSLRVGPVVAQHDPRFLPPFQHDAPPALLGCLKIGPFPIGSRSTCIKLVHAFIFDKQDTLPVYVETLRATKRFSILPSHGKTIADTR